MADAMIKAQSLARPKSPSDQYATPILPSTCASACRSPSSLTTANSSSYRLSALLGSPVRLKASPRVRRALACRSRSPLCCVSRSACSARTIASLKSSKFQAHPGQIAQRSPLSETVADLSTHLHRGLEAFDCGLHLAYVRVRLSDIG